MSVRFTSREIRERYREFAPKYDLWEGTADRLLGISRLRKRWFRRHARGRVLEVAAGTGASLAGLRQIPDLIQTDLTHPMLQHARAKAQRRGVMVRFAVADVQQLPFADGSFDTVVSSLSFCTVPDPLAGIREMIRVCRPGGRIVLIEHGLSGRGWIDRWLHRRDERHAASLACHPNRDHLARLAEAGIHPTQVRRSHLGIVQRFLVELPDAPQP